MNSTTNIYHSIDSNNLTYQLSIMYLRMLQVYNNALLINADCRTKDALNYIEKEFELLESHRGSLSLDDTDRYLNGLYTS